MLSDGSTDVVNHQTVFESGSIVQILNPSTGIEQGSTDDNRWYLNSDSEAVIEGGQSHTNQIHSVGNLTGVVLVGEDTTITQDLNGNAIGQTTGNNMDADLGHESSAPSPIEGRRLAAIAATQTSANLLNSAVVAAPSGAVVVVDQTVDQGEDIDQTGVNGAQAEVEVDEGVAFTDVVQDNRNMVNTAINAGLGSQLEATQILDANVEIGQDTFNHADAQSEDIYNGGIANTVAVQDAMNSVNRVELAGGEDPLQLLGQQVYTASTSEPLGNANNTMEAISFDGPGDATLSGTQRVDDLISSAYIGGQGTSSGTTDFVQRSSSPVDQTTGYNLAEIEGQAWACCTGPEPMSGDLTVDVAQAGNTELNVITTAGQLNGDFLQEASNGAQQFGNTIAADTIGGTRRRQQ